MNEGLVYSKLKNYANSIECYNKVNEIKPNQACIYMGKQWDKKQKEPKQIDIKCVFLF